MSREANIRATNEIIKSVPSLYLLKNYFIRGNPLTFENISNARGHRPWQRAIIEDNHPYLVVRKSRQLGFSEVSIMKAIWLCDRFANTKCLYTFPTNRQMKDFVKTRLDPAINSSKYFKDELFDNKVASIETKRMTNDSFMMFRSASSGSMGEGIDIDFLFMDEIDRMASNVHLAFQESLKSSKYGWQRFWSTPTVPGNGIDKFFEDSDQRLWMNKCTHCNHWQFMTVEDNILQINPNGVNKVTDEVAKGTFMFVCSKCGKELDRRVGEYVAKYPDRQGVRGYHISQLNAEWITADRIKQNELKYSSKQLFQNYVIGIPYAQVGMIVTEHDIQAGIQFDSPKTSRQGYKYVVAGIDWGADNWCVLLGMKENGDIDMLNYFVTKDNPTKPLGAVQDLARMIAPYNPNLIIADFGYGADRNSLLMQIFKGKTWACQFNTYKGASKPMNSWNENSKIVSVDKTLNMQRVIHRLKEHSIGFWRYDEAMQMVYKHASNMRIMDEEDDNTGIIYQIYRRLGGDHTMSALCYALVGMERLKNPYQRDRGINFDFI